MRKFILCDSLVNEIASQQDVEVIIHKFYEIYGEVNDNHRASLRRLLLHASTEHNHIELTTYLLCNARYDSDALKSCSLTEATVSQDLCPSAEKKLCDSLNDETTSSPPGDVRSSNLLQDGPVRSKPSHSCSLKDLVVFFLVLYLRVIVTIAKWILLLFFPSLRGKKIVCDTLQDTPTSDPRKEEIVTGSCGTLRGAKSSKQSLAEEIVELLMSNDVEHNQKGIRSLIGASPGTFKHARGGQNPILTVITLIEDCYFERRSLSLPDIVHLLINRGASVHDHLDGFTALNYLTSRIIDMQAEDDNIATQGNSMIMDTARVLLANKCDPNCLVANAGLDGRGLSHPIDYLMRIIKCHFIYSKDSRDDERGHLYLLTGELLEVLLMHGAQPRKSFGLNTYDYVFYKSTLFATAYEFKASIPGYLTFCNNVLDGLGNVYRCFWMIEFMFNPDAFLSKGEEADNEVVTDMLINITAYSSSCRPSHGRSTKIIRHIFNTLSTTQISIFKVILTRRLTTMKELSPEDLSSFLDDRMELKAEFLPSHLHIYTKNALSWIVEVEKSFNLQHLARHSIVKAMGPKSLSGVSTLGLPEHLERFVLFKIDEEEFCLLK